MQQNNEINTIQQRPGHYGEGTPPFYGARMRQKSINLPEYMHKWINEHGGSAYIRALVDADMARRKLMGKRATKAGLTD